MLKNLRIVVCDFPSSTASSRTKGTLTLRELVRHGLPLVWSLDSEEMSELRSMLSPVEGPSTGSQPDQLSLFEALAQGHDDDDSEGDERPMASEPHGPV